MYRNVKISVIEVVGKTDLLFDNINSLDENDLFGCAIDKKSAYDLFGSYNVIGKQINYNGDKYIIRSTFESPKNTLIINMKSNSLTTLNTVTVVRDHGTTDKNIKDLLLTKYGIAGELIDYNFISDLFKISLLFIMIFLFFSKIILFVSIFIIFIFTNFSESYLYQIFIKYELNNYFI